MMISMVIYHSYGDLDISYLDDPMIYSLVSSNIAGWKLPELNGGFKIGKSRINGSFSIAMFDYRRAPNVQCDFPVRYVK